jgi:general L-amino acid transport system permease protein
MIQTQTSTSDNVLPPPVERYTILGWIYRNLFSSWFNALLTFAALALVYAVGKGLITWAVTQANWNVVLVNMRLLMVGQYPVTEMWRVWLCVHLLAAVGGLSWGIWVRGYRLVGLLVLASLLGMAFAVGSASARGHLIAAPVVALTAYVLGRLAGRRIQRTVITLGSRPPLASDRERIGARPIRWIVSSNLWGGLLLTLLLTAVGILVSFPMGILLALGRRSKLPIIRWTSIGYIELVRGVPLVTILFMAQIMLPLFLPSGMQIDRVVRAMVGIILFTAAYQAENIRGGLQAIPPGQFDAPKPLD